MLKESYFKGLNLTSRAKRALSFGKCYTSCAELPLKRFIKVSVTSDLRHLTISGRPTKEQLEQAWQDILEDYASQTKSTTHKAYLNALKEIAQLKTKIFVIQETIQRMAERPNEGFAELLRSLGFRFTYNPEDREQYQKDLKLTVSQSKTMLIRIAQREKDLESFIEHKDITELDYEDLLSEMGKFQGYRLDPKIITVSEFISILNRFKIANQPKK